VDPFNVVEPFAAILERAGLRVERGAFEGRRSLTGASRDHERLLVAFCEVARLPVDRSVRRHGEKWTLPDHPDADLLLHESGLQTREEHPDDQFYAVTFGRQFSFENRRGDYVGMHVFHLSLETDGLPEGRVPTAQRWGYGGPAREKTSDEHHAEVSNWAGHTESWAAAVRASNSWKVFDALPMVRFSAIQDDI
jgi:hypothetical protein